MPVTMRNPKNDDVRVVPDALEGKYADRGFEVQSRSEALSSNDLKGKQLHDALTDAGLSTSGTADEKRARLAEHTQNSGPDGTPPQA